MRAGATVGRLETAQATPASIARMMVGREVSLALDSGVIGTRDAGRGTRQSEAQPGAPIPASRLPAPALAVSQIVVASSRRLTAVDHVSFTVARGEILGLAGVEGNGQTELIE